MQRQIKLPAPCLSNSVAGFTGVATSVSSLGSTRQHKRKFIVSGVYVYLWEYNNK